jgi:hypothetical protein
VITIDLILLHNLFYFNFLGEPGYPGIKGDKGDRGYQGKQIYLNLY